MECRYIASSFFLVMYIIRRGTTGTQVSVIEGSEAVLNCPLGGTFSDIIWTFVTENTTVTISYPNSATINPNIDGHERMSVEAETGNLKIKNAQFADQRTYRCQVFGSLDTSDITFVIYVPPVYGVEGHGATFDFRISNESGLTIYVKHPSTGSNMFGILSTGTLVAAEDRVTNYTESTRTRVKFTLSGLTVTDAGVYIASTDVSSDIGSQELKIIGKPTKPAITDTDIPVVGQSHTIRCSTTSTSTAGIIGLTMTYQWYRNNVTVSTDGRYTNIYNELTISSVVGTDDNDRFQCEAWENDLAKSDKSEKHSIPEPQYPPSITHIPDKSIFQGTSITVTCQASGNPTPTYRWTKSGDSSFNQSGSTLTFTDIQTYDAGTYICHAENVMRPANSSTGMQWSDTEDFTINVKVQTKPDRPALFSIATVSKLFIVAQWTSQFNGGATQNFIVQYKQITAANWTDVNNPIPDPGQNETVYYVLHGIDLVHVYQVRVYAKNVIGKSDFTEELISKVTEQNEYSEQLKDTDWKSTVIALGVVCAILAIVILVCTVLFFLRKKKEIFKKRTSYREQKKEVKLEDLTPAYDEVQNINEPAKDTHIASKEMTYETKCVPSMSPENQYDQVQTGTSFDGEGDTYQNTSI